MNRLTLEIGRGEISALPPISFRWELPAYLDVFVLARYTSAWEPANPAIALYPTRKFPPPHSNFVAREALTKAGGFLPMMKCRETNYIAQCVRGLAGFILGHI